MIYWGNRSLAAVRATMETYQRRMQDRLAAGKPLYLEIDPHLGWRLQKSCRHPTWPYTTDALGNRRSAADGAISAGSSYRIAIAGNSYVHCDEAADEETWVWKLQELLGPGHRLHNLGVTAYSTDQAFLRLQEFAAESRPDMAVLALTTTDIYRNLNMCRAFIMNDSEVPLYKPRFVAEGEELALRPPPAASLDKLTALLGDRDALAYLACNDVFFPTYARQAGQILRRFRVPVRDVWQRNFDEAIAMTTRIGRHFVAWCRARDIVPVLLLLPVYWGAFPAGREFDIFAREFRENVALIDARDVFTPERLQLSRSELAHRFNHYTPRVSSWLADHIGERLQAAIGQATRRD